MFIASFFIDDKIYKVTSGKTLLYKTMRILASLYKPVALMRMRCNLTCFLIEPVLYRIFSRLLFRVRK